MSNRVIKDSIWDSPTLDPMPDYYEDQVPRWLLLGDDWGCFNANPERIKGMVYPNRKKETAIKIKEIIRVFNEYGLLFLWEDQGRQWGYFVSNDKHHNFCNGTQVDDSGKRVKHRRKTPEPPQSLLRDYLEKSGTSWDKVGHAGTKGSNPKPNPIPKPKPNKTEHNITLGVENSKNRTLSTKDYAKFFNRFETIWGIYPHKMARHKAVEAFFAHVRGEGMDYYRELAFAVRCEQRAQWNATMQNIRRSPPPGYIFFGTGYKDYSKFYKAKKIPEIYLPQYKL